MTRRVPLIFWIALLSFFIRLVFLLRVPPPAITMWGDDGYYRQTGLQLSEYLRKGDSLLKELFHGNLFQGHGLLEKYRLEIPWGTVKRGLGYPVFLALVFWLAGPDPFWVFLTQAFLTSLAGVFLYGIAAQLGQKTVGLLSAALVGIYPPMIFIGSRLIQEALALFLFPLFYFLLFCCRRTRSAWVFVSTGLVLSFLAFSRSALSYFPFFLALSFISKSFRNWAFLHWKNLWAFGLSFSIPFLLWMTAVFWLSGQAGSVALHNPGRFPLSASLPENDGWLTDLFLLGRPNQELAGLLNREGISVVRAGDGGFLWPPESQTVRVAQRHMLQNPWAFFQASLNKFRRLWWQPYDWPWREFLFSPEPLRWFHRYLVVAAVVGWVLWWFERPFSLGLLLIPVLYGSLIHNFYHIESRYGLIYFIFPILFASFFIHLLWEKRRLIFFPLRRLEVGLGILLAGGLTYHFSGPPFLLKAFQGLDASQAHLWGVGIQSLLLISFFFMAGLWLKGILSRRRLVASLFAASLLVLLPFETYAFTTEDWHAWSVPLKGPGPVLRQEIFLPPGSLAGALNQNLRMDLKIPEEAKGEVWVNGRAVAAFDAFKSRHPQFPFRSYAIILREGKRRPFEMRQWFTLPIPSHLLEEGKFNRLEIHPKGEVVVFGDYPLRDSSRPLFRGPLFQHLNNETSVLKFAYDGDFRLNGSTPLHNGGVRSSFYDGRRWRADDLSPSAGIQTGEYRLRIEIERPRGKFLIY